MDLIRTSGASLSIVSERAASMEAPARLIGSDSRAKEAVTQNVEPWTVSAISILIRTMKPLNVHGEYWYTDGRDLITVDDGGDYNHEGYVLRSIIDLYCGALGLDNQFDTDTTWFRVELGDREDTPPEGEDWMDEIEIRLKRDGISEGQIQNMRDLLNNHGDAREFAVKWWGWIRISHGAAELPKLTPDFLRRLYEALEEAFYEEQQEELQEFSDPTDTFQVSTYNGTRYVAEVGALKLGKLDGYRASMGAQSTPDAVKKLDLKDMPPFYRGHLGDSIESLNMSKRVLLEAADTDLFESMSQRTISEGRRYRDRRTR